MTLDRSQAGRPSTFGDLARVFDEPNVQGDGILCIDEDSDPKRFAWHPFDSQTAKPIRSETVLDRIGLHGGKYLQSPRTATQQQNNESMKEYESRLFDLRYEAVQDGCELNVASESDFIDFIRSSVDLNRGNLVLLENGNLRMIWKDREGTQLGLQFLGGRAIQFVIFKQRTGTEQVSRVAGRDSLDEITNLIGAFDLQKLVLK